MAIQLGTLRTALVEAGATDDKADKASEEVAAFETRISGLDTRLAVLTGMAGANLALILGVLGSMLLMWSKLGELSGQAAQLARSAH